MALPTVVAGSLRTSMTLTWTVDDAPLNLTGATITGTLKPKGGAVRAIAGAISVTDAASGSFSWALHANDVVEGVYKVQFNAAFAAGATPAKTFVEEWVVKGSLA